ncbi:MAG: HAD family phosphatase [Candidatus Doudnabacteria bacterium]|nr:HAD family phosphatase [Candidatus Doudnabacteria bacterium]
MRRAVLWDFDGVLFPTEGLRDETHQEVVHALGGQISPDFYRKIKGAGRAHEEVRAEFIQASGIKATPEKYTRIFQKVFQQKLRSLAPTPGVMKTLCRLQTRRYLQAVVSSSPRLEVLPPLVRAGLVPFFDTVVCGDDVIRPKPAPDGYLKAVADLETQSLAGVAVEDSWSGVEAASTAGLKVITFRHEYNLDHDFSKACQVVIELTEIPERTS